MPEKSCGWIGEDFLGRVGVRVNGQKSFWAGWGNLSLSVIYRLVEALSFGLPSSSQGWSMSSESKRPKARQPEMLRILGLTWYSVSGSGAGSSGKGKERSSQGGTVWKRSMKKNCVRPRQGKAQQVQHHWLIRAGADKTPDIPKPLEPNEKNKTRRLKPNWGRLPFYFIDLEHTRSSKEKSGVEHRVSSLDSSRWESLEQGVWGLEAVSGLAGLMGDGTWL